jgi:hypothetical protein
MSAFPEQYSTLISAIIKAGGGATGAKIPLSAVRNEIGEKALALEMLKYGWETIEQWVDGACLERYTEKGSSGNSIWVMLNVVSNSQSTYQPVKADWNWLRCTNGADNITDHACKSETCH